MEKELGTGAARVACLRNHANRADPAGPAEMSGMVFCRRLAMAMSLDWNKVKRSTSVLTELRLIMFLKHLENILPVRNFYLYITRVFPCFPARY